MIEVAGGSRGLLGSRKRKRLGLGYVLDCILVPHPTSQYQPIKKVRGGLKSVPVSKISKTTPKQDGQHDHEKGVRPQVGRDGEVAIQRRGAHLVLDHG